MGAQNLALACQRTGSALLYVSTDFVFGGERATPYTEFDTPDPVGAYGRSKYAGECYVTRLLDRFYICRTSWLFGSGGSNFVKSILQAGRDNDEVRVVCDQEGSPTYSSDLARKLLTQSNLPISRIAEECGFSSQSHLTASFRSAHSVTPALYRAHVRKAAD